MNSKRTQRTIIPLTAAVFISTVLCATSATNATVMDTVIDRMAVGEYTRSYSPGSAIIAIGSSRLYYLSDGSTWARGAGVGQLYSTHLASVSLSGTTVKYQLDMPIGEAICENFDHDSQNHRSNGVLVSTAPLVLTATLNSTVATLSGFAEIASNPNIPFPEPSYFSYYAADVGDWAPFEVTYTIKYGKTWNLETFNSSFKYSLYGVVDFANAIPEPGSMALLTMGALALLKRRSRRRCK